MKHRKAFKEEQVDDNSLTSILIHTPTNLPITKKSIYLSVPNTKKK